MPDLRFSGPGEPIGSAHTLYKALLRQLFCLVALCLIGVEDPRSPRKPPGTGLLLGLFAFACFFGFLLILLEEDADR